MLWKFVMEDEVGYIALLESSYYTISYHKPFYPRDAMLGRVIAIATCLSVRLSRAGIVSKRRKLAS